MTAKPDPGQSRKQILDDHRRIGELLSKIASTDSAAESRVHLEELHPLLVRHFKHEEDAIDGLHAVILERTPEHSAALLALSDEHQRLLARVDELRAKWSDAEDRDPRLQDLGRLLKEELANHERHETAIFVDSIWTDLGAGD